MCDTIGDLRTFLGRAPSYLEFFGFWLNKKKIFYRRAASVAFGYAVANGSKRAPLEYYQAITDGEGEALMLKGKDEAREQDG